MSKFGKLRKFFNIRKVSDIDDRSNNLIQYFWFILKVWCLMSDLQISTFICWIKKDGSIWITLVTVPNQWFQSVSGPNGIALKFNWGVYLQSIHYFNRHLLSQQLMKSHHCKQLHTIATFLLSFLKCQLDLSSFKIQISSSNVRLCSTLSKTWPFAGTLFHWS